MRGIQRIIAVFLLLFTAHSFVGGQIIYRIGPENADCSNAIQLYDTLYGPTTPPKGFGAILEFSSQKNDLYSFEIEHNTVWYMFETFEYCDLLLDIIPLSKNDDYDFILFREEGSNTCQQIKDRKITPVRSCISRNDTSINSMTGLSYSAQNEFIHAGPGASYAKALPVKAGERYLLVLDNVYPEGQGHKLHIQYRNCKEPPPPVVEAPSNFLNINVKDAGTFQMLDADIILTNKTNPKATEPVQIWEKTGSLITKIDQQTTYQIVVKANGYFQYTDQVKTGTDFQTYLKTVNLVKIEAGKKISFNSILFIGGSDQFLRESYPILEDITQTLKDQPGIVVEIIGHVNEPYNNRSGNSAAQNQDLSERRAKAVFDFLIRKGIASSRLSWVGKGNTEMLYPYANSEEQMQANRRVELLIKEYGNKQD